MRDKIARIRTTAAQLLWHHTVRTAENGTKLHDYGTVQQYEILQRLAPIGAYTTSFLGVVQ